MAAPTAPMALKRQVVDTGTIVCTVPLKAMDGQFTGFGAPVFNVGSPTATYTIAVNGTALGSSVNASRFGQLLDLLDDLQRDGGAVVT